MKTKFHSKVRSVAGKATKRMKAFIAQLQPISNPKTDNMDSLLMHTSSLTTVIEETPSETTESSSILSYLDDANNAYSNLRCHESIISLAQNSRPSIYSLIVNESFYYNDQNCPEKSPPDDRDKQYQMSILVHDSIRSQELVGMIISKGVQDAVSEEFVQERFTL